MNPSFIFGTRNDDYCGGNQIKNLLGAVESISRLDPHEIIIGEWNPPKDRERVLDIIKRHGFKRIKIVTFEESIQDMLDEERLGSPQMNFYEFVIKHFCAQHATSDALVFTNVDDVFMPDGWIDVLEHIKSGIGITGCRLDADTQDRPDTLDPKEYVDKVLAGIRGCTIKHEKNYGPFGDFYAIMKEEYFKNPYQLCHKNEFVDCEIIIRSKSYKITDYSTVHFRHPETGGLGKPGRPYGDHLTTPPQMISDKTISCIPNHITLENTGW